MSEISIRFRLTTDDMASYTKAVSGGKKRFISFAFCVIALFFAVRNIISENGSYVLSALLILFVSVVILRPFLEVLIVKKYQKNYYGLKTDISLDFFDDHIVEKSAGGETKIEFENHFPLEAIKNIIETKEHYAFFVSPIEAILAPKRAMSEEDKEKIRNLIENVFSDRYENRS